MNLFRRAAPLRVARGRFRMLEDAPGASRAVAFCTHCGASSAGGPYCTTCGKPMSSLAANPYVPQAPQPAPAAALGAPTAAPQRQRPIGVTLVAVGFFLMTAGVALVFLFLLFFASLGAAIDWGWFEPFAGAFGAIMMAVALFALFLAAFLGAVAYGLLQGQAWAWVAALVVTGLAVLSGVAGLVQGEFDSIIELALWGGAAFCLLQPEARAYFGRT